jgi:hypothetical protein
MSDHLTEEQIQLYLDKQEFKDMGLIDEHLQSCVSCIKSVEHYKMIYKALGASPFPALSKGFSEQVILKISGQKRSPWHFFESGFTIAFFLFGIAASIYFVNPLPFISTFINNLFRYMGGIASKFLPELNGNIPIFVVAIFIFLLIELIDKKVLRPRP